MRNVGNSRAKYSENEIYQHITNCQVFLSYNADETKLLKRRAGFKESMESLLKLAEQGSIYEASRSRISKTLRGFVKWSRGFFKSKPVTDHEKALEPMRALGLSVATRILSEEKDTGKAAAILLLTALDVAYISVLAVCFTQSCDKSTADEGQFTAVLDHLLQGAYDLAEKRDSGSSDWFEIQRLAMNDDDESDTKIQLKVLEAQRQSLRLPFIRKVIKDGVKIPVNGKKEPLRENQTIICDIVSPAQDRKILKSCW